MAERMQNSKRHDVRWPDPELQYALQHVDDEEEEEEKRTMWQRRGLKDYESEADEDEDREDAQAPAQSVGKATQQGDPKRQAKKVSFLPDIKAR